MTNDHPRDARLNTQPGNEREEAWRSALVGALEGATEEGSKALATHGLALLRPAGGFVRLRQRFVH
jgi:hypothetical protein